MKTYRDNTKRLIKWLGEEKKITEPNQVTSSMIDDYIDSHIGQRIDAPVVAVFG